MHAGGLRCYWGSEDFKRTSGALDTPEPSTTRTHAPEREGASKVRPSTGKQRGPLSGPKTPLERLQELRGFTLDTLG
jgi:hypothetical protein